MEGTKKKSLKSMEKKQDTGGKQEDASAQKGKKEKEGKEPKGGPQQQKRLPFLAPKMTEAEMVKSLTPLKAITVYTASRALGVNASIATGILRGLEAKSLLRRYVGYSGHVVWATV